MSLSFSASHLDRFRSPFCIFLALTYVIAGTAHFTNTDFYLPMMPDYLPWHLELIYISGVFEILGGIGLMIPTTRKLAGWGIVALLFAVFPANIHIVINDVQLAKDPISPVAMWLRLPFQLVFIGSVWWAASLKETLSSAEKHPESHPPSA